MSRASARGVTRRAAALLILDLISEFQFEDWRRILSAAQRVAPRIERLRRRAHAAAVPVIYVNDSGEHWESDRTAFIRRATRSGARGSVVARLLAPTDQDHFVFKPRHSGFYATPLADLLDRLKVGRLILTGLTTHQCVLFTAVDAYVRDFELIVPPDCIGAPQAVQTRHALFVLREALNARTPRSDRIRLR
jgi:nicotinamidase-related amidase